jgi:two-component system phosphate regulon sensor histidine kinase PhoR
MRRTRLLWQLFPTYLFITVIAVAAASVYAFVSLRHFYHEEMVGTLTARARLIEERVRSESLPDRAREVDVLVKKLGGAAETRITVVLPSGEVVADSEADPATMGNHGDRPEIVAALAGSVGVAERPSPTLGTDMLYVAVPLMDDERTAGAVGAALPLTALSADLAAVGRRLAASAGLVCVLAGAVSLLVSRRLSRPIEEMTRGAARFARGELTYSMPVPKTAELAALAESLNRTAAELDAKVRAVNQKLMEEEAVLAGMTEGVIAVDADERIISMNRAAGEMLRADPSSVKGRALREVVRSSDIQGLAAEALEAEGPIERQVPAIGRDQQSLQGRGAPLLGADGRRAGAVLVLNDMTRLRRLENVRRDFVTNVSHELRTPVTSIRGYVETLLEGGASDAEESRRFLSIVAKHAERLETLIEDLLYLSRIEQEADRVLLPREDTPIVDVLRAAVESRKALAGERGVLVELKCDGGVRAAVNAALLEHAVANLIDNAVKYSEREGVVQVECEGTGAEVVLRVRDRGCGIAEEHLDRIFERFYRVDKGRSRELGGTGLGLAIVKHIVQAHGGSVGVESAPGRGSTFTIRFPRA